jgi:hypothetical protein
MSNKAHNRFLISVIVFCLSAFAVVTTAFAQEREALRPPAVPLVTHDPYLSVWSMSDNLTDESTKHWTGASHGLVGMARFQGPVGGRRRLHQDVDRRYALEEMV